MNLNSFPSPFPIEQINDIDHGHQLHWALNLGPTHDLVSSSSASSHFFFDSTQDHKGLFYHQQLYQPHHQQDGEHYAYDGQPSFEIKNKVECRPDVAPWKKREDQGQGRNVSENSNEVKYWSISPKMRAKNLDDRTASTINLQKLQSSSDLKSNSSSNTLIRVCSDCHTTKTPLWRSGPKGPKSLCNACGIRQRKARRAMAAAAASREAVASDQPRPVKIKVQFKKRRKVAANGEGSSESRGSFEDLLINLSNEIALHRVFPQDEKDAAILLMALSSGLVRG